PEVSGMADLREQVMTRGRPLPQLTLDNHEFYEAARKGGLRFQRCKDCGACVNNPAPPCPQCLLRQYGWERVSGRGRIYTWTIVHGPTLPAFQGELPYNVVDVLLDEGIHFQSQLLACRPEDIHPDMRVESVFVPVSDDVTLVKFRRTAG